jgi:hypothetical protein
MTTSWQQFAKAEPEMAEHGRRLLMLGKDHGDFEGGLAYLATVRGDGGPRVHPISPVLHLGKLYAFILRTSPKRNDLLRDGRFALHSYPYPLSADFTDEEFYLSGRATLVENETIRRAVAEGCGDDVDAGDVFELHLERAMRKSRPKGAAAYEKWKSGIDD